MEPFDYFFRHLFLMTTQKKKKKALENYLLNYLHVHARDSLT
jgi:hypothetical protein